MAEAHERDDSAVELDPGVGVPAGLALAFFGSMVVQIFLVFPPAIGLAWLGAATAGLLWLHWRHRSAVALGPVGVDHRIALIAAVPIVLILGIGTSGLIQLWAGPIPFPIPLPEGNAIERYTAPFPGWVVFTLYAVVVGPVLEEFAFRGWIQRSVGYRFGGAVGVAAGALLFTVFHAWYAAPAAMLLPLVMGVVWGSSVQLTGSVWAGVVLHGAWNLLLMTVQRTRLEPNLLFYWSPNDVGAPVPVFMVACSGILLYWLGRRQQISAGSKAAARQVR